ncbi:hypothetical protein BJF88_03000 [Cellulosimicrobium sp. CUA-896]|nr:hypothetical protein BJF88_03000 [Cellulosimicrobium sp. CUA-896]
MSAAILRTPSSHVVGSSPGVHAGSSTSASAPPAAEAPTWRATSSASSAGGAPRTMRRSAT